MTHLPNLLIILLAIPATAYSQTPAKPRDTVLPTATVLGHTPPIQHKKDRTIINVEASPTNTGATVLEVLAKSPGVLVMIDDKLTYLTGQDLNNLLSSMNAGEVSKIELIPNPPARYDASGSAGIVNITNQFTFHNGFTAELTGFYTTRAREDIQELQYPTGQASTGLSKTVLKKKGTVKLSFRDLFYTGSFSGLTSFPDASEYFKIKRDSRVVALSFNYRFGKSYKVTSHQGSAPTPRPSEQPVYRNRAASHRKRFIHYWLSNEYLNGTFLVANPVQTARLWLGTISKPPGGA